MDQPLVSVVIPFYSGVSWLKEALDSVLNQTYKNTEILVINDGSKEDIADLVNDYNLNVNFIYKKNGGPASARNLGIEKSSGKYIAFLDSDDMWLPDKLSKQITEMELYNYYWSQHSYEMFWDTKKKSKIINTMMHTGNVYKDCFTSFKVQTSCVVVLRSIIIENNIRFPVQKRFGQDLDFYKQIAKKYPIGFVDGVHSRFRIRGSNAGFRAAVQLNDKATTWKEIKKEKETLKILSSPVIVAYKISYLFNKIIGFINKRSIVNGSLVEYISKGVYLLPYLIFKLSSIKKKYYGKKEA